MKYIALLLIIGLALHLSHISNWEHRLVEVNNGVTTTYIKELPYAPIWEKPHIEGTGNVMQNWEFNFERGLLLTMIYTALFSILCLFVPKKWKNTQIVRLVNSVGWSLPVSYTHLTLPTSDLV